MKKDKAPIIIKKIKKSSGHGHHGGAWKIAYADFVTAMMAFFLLMWLLNATSVEQKLGIANYFDPISLGQNSGGSNGVMGGHAITSKFSSLESAAGPMSIRPSPLQHKGHGGNDKTETSNNKSKKTYPLSRENALKSAKEAEKMIFKEIKESLEKSVGENPELKELLKNLTIDETPEGLRIQVLDQERQAMFTSGSSEVDEKMQKLLDKIADIIKKVPNAISISGHTDATPYSEKNHYSNWELSSDRANASRRTLIQAGVDAQRFAQVVGKEAQDPFLKDNPTAPQNRRISIVLLRQDKEAEGAEGAEEA